MLKKNKYFNQLIGRYLNNHFGLSLAPAQLQVLEAMLLYDYTLFIHGRAVGATFMLAILSIILRLVDPEINIAVAAPILRQADCVTSEAEAMSSRFKLKPLEAVAIKEVFSREYDVLLLDEVSQLPDEYVENLITNIEGESIPKIVAASCGFRRYFPIIKLYRCLCSNNNRIVITKSYEDMPEGVFGIDSIEKIKKVYDYPEEFDMDYRGYII